MNEDGKAVKGSKVLVVGVAYKKDISDVRESPAIDIISLLKRKGAQVLYHDPHVPAFSEHGIVMDSVKDLNQEVKEADCVVIVTDHSIYEWESISEMSKLLVDTRNVIKS